MILVVYINEIRENTLSSKVSKTKWPELCYKTSSLTVTKHVKAGLYNISWQHIMQIDCYGHS